MLRRSAVAGRFYPGETDHLLSVLGGFAQQRGQRIRAVGLVVPHAGYMYSGHVAGEVYSRVEVPARCIMMCPNHTGLGSPVAIMQSGEWETPLGRVPIDEAMATELLSLDPDLKVDASAHRLEHALEVQLPFLQFLAGDFQFVPIALGIHDLPRLRALGQAIARVVDRIDPSALIIASSDMNHYESDARTRVKDRKAIDKMLQLDPEGLHETVQREDISMCGYGPATAMLVAARERKALTAELVRYATSGDVSGDPSFVVGYAGLVIS